MKGTLDAYQCLRIVLTGVWKRCANVCWVWHGLWTYFVRVISGHSHVFISRCGFRVGSLSGRASDDPLLFYF